MEFSTVKQKLDALSLKEVKELYFWTFIRDILEEKLEYEKYAILANEFDSYVYNRRLAEGDVSDLERRFREEYEAVSAKIGEQLKLAHEALREAEELSSENGIPFGANVSAIS